MRAVVSGDDLGRVEAVAANLPNEQMAVSTDGHRRDHDDGGWMLRDGAHVVALKANGFASMQPAVAGDSIKPGVERSETPGI